PAMHVVEGARPGERHLRVNFVAGDAEPFHRLAPVARALQTSNGRERRIKVPRQDVYAQPLPESKDAITRSLDEVTRRAQHRKLPVTLAKSPRRDYKGAAEAVKKDWAGALPAPAPSARRVHRRRLVTLAE